MATSDCEWSIALVLKLIVSPFVPASTSVFDTAFEGGNIVSPNSVAANGSTFTNKFQGIIPKIVVDYYNERKEVKKLMLIAMQDNEKNPSIELEKEINRHENQQMAIKILLNSLYGALGNKYFKYFDVRLAEGVTLTGQLTIQWAEKAMNIIMNELLKTNKDYYRECSKIAKFNYQQHFHEDHFKI